MAERRGRYRTIKNPPPLGESSGGYFAEVERLNQKIERQLELVRVPKRVEEVAAGVLEGNFLKYWWITPNTLIWHRDGVFEKSPKQVWEEGFCDYVIQFIWAMRWGRVGFGTEVS